MKKNTSGQTRTVKTTPPNINNAFNPILAILDVKREIKATTDFLCAAFGAIEGAESSWELEKAIVTLNHVHQWIAENNCNCDITF